MDTFPYKPCPFCGKNEQIIMSNYENCTSNRYDGTLESWEIVCDASSDNKEKGCGASSGFHGTSRLAQDYWNKRDGDA